MVLPLASKRMNLSRHFSIGAITVLLAAGVGLVVWRKWSVAPNQSQLVVPRDRPVAKAAASRPLNLVVSQILKEGPSTPYLKFNYLIKELPVDLGDHDLKALIEFISGPKPTGFQDAEWGSLVNDIEKAITLQTVPNPLVAEGLIAIYRDESKIQMQRDYALQHIGGFAMHLVQAESATSGDVSSPSKIESRQSPIFNLLLSELTSAAGQTDKPWSGTALNLLDGLLRNAEYSNINLPDLTSQSLLEMALPIARDPSATLNARLPALQVAARHESPAARELAREILSSPNADLMLVQSAAAALAHLGTAEDLPLLQAASASATRHTAPALNEAIRSIQTRPKSD